MRTYAQYCPIVRAVEVVGERWTLLIVREMLTGTRRFNDLGRGLPGLSRGLLARRLRQLAAAGLVVKADGPDGDGGYDLTPAGEDLRPLVFGLAEWGARHAFGDPRPEELDPETLMWWFHGRIDTSEVARRAVVQVEVTDRKRTYWLLVEPGDASVCYTDPGFAVDAVLRSDLATLFRMWEGEIELLDAVKAGDIELTGPAGWSPACPVGCSSARSRRSSARPRAPRAQRPPAERRPCRPLRRAYPLGVLGRITIDDVRPSTPSGEFPAKAVVGDEVAVSADIFRDGHDLLAARVRWRRVGKAKWRSAPLRSLINDHWEGTMCPTEVGRHEFVVEAWRDRFATWRHDVEIKAAAGDDVELELEEGARILEALAAGVGARARRRVLDAVAGLRRGSCSLQVRLNAGLDDRVAELVAPVPDADVTTVVRGLWVDRPLAGHGAWYELFPRSEGGFPGATKRLTAVAEMGFDVVYLPPIHPIGVTARKGAGNTLDPAPDDPGSPWAIGSAEGGHTAIAPELGTLDDFRAFCTEAAHLGMEVALDYALNCSPDHPWVAEHPEWFWRRPDGSIRYAENPPKKYQDIFPINFWPERDADRAALWKACRDVLRHWIDQGVRIFRVDNPHTKPMAFWAWIIERIQRDHPEVIFLSEAFTRPKVMAKLAEVGFTQSYTYFTWRTEPWELRAYVEELAYGPTASYMRPNFWPNTPDILSGPLRHGPPAAFLVRYVLAATLVPSYGVYSGYELFENEPASDTSEEYRHSEKYELRRRDWDRADSMAPFIATVNGIRRRHPAFRTLGNIRFHGTSNGSFLVWTKGDVHDGDLVLVVVNLDPHHAQETVLELDLGAVGLPWHGPLSARDELTGETYMWDGNRPYVRLDPTQGHVAHIISFGG